MADEGFESGIRIARLVRKVGKYAVAVYPDKANATGISVMPVASHFVNMCTSSEAYGKGDLSELLPGNWPQKAGTVR